METIDKKQKLGVILKRVNENRLKFPEYREYLNFFMECLNEGLVEDKVSSAEVFLNAEVFLFNEKDGENLATLRRYLTENVIKPYARQELEVKYGDVKAKLVDMKNAIKWGISIRTFSYYADFLRLVFLVDMEDINFLEHAQTLLNAEVRCLGYHEHTIVSGYKEGLKQDIEAEKERRNASKQI